MSLCVDSEAAVLHAIDESVCEAFRLMAAIELQQIESACVLESKPATRGVSNAITVLVGLTGDLNGSLSLTMTEEAAQQWTESLIEVRPSEIDQNVVDSVGELGNIVVGGAKRRLSDFDLTMSLPRVFCAGLDVMGFQTGSSPKMVKYEFEGGEVTILVALSKRDGCDVPSHTTRENELAGR